jgi:hypothetical protein
MGDAVGANVWTGAGVSEGETGKTVSVGFAWHATAKTKIASRKVVNRVRVMVFLIVFLSRDGDIYGFRLHHANR